MLYEAPDRQPGGANCEPDAIPFPRGRKPNADVDRLLLGSGKLMCCGAPLTSLEATIEVALTP